ncbi:hypothetical protein MUP65_00135 [Patescibacteria group bacterium]|nr:hypothetical protein [Patescibacteria group bacterium]
MLVGGVGLILWSAWSTYQVYTGQQEAPTVFKISAEPISLPVPSQVPGMEVDPIELDFFPTEMIGQTTNMAIYLVLMGFLSLAGGRLASVGAKLLQTVKVYLRESKVLAEVKPTEAVVG